MLKRIFTCARALPEWQTGIVLATFILTAIGAMLLIYGFTRWNAWKAAK